MVDRLDAQASAEDIAQSELAPAVGGRSRVVIAGLALLLLLLCVSATIADVFVTRSPDQVKFITRNIACLQCHTEMIAQMSKTSVHNPFLLKQCTTCHTPHGTEVLETRTTGGRTTWQSFKTVLEWLPLRLACWSSDGPAGVAGSSAGGQTTTKSVKSKGAKSNLVMAETELCWMCHGNLGAMKSMAYQHAPFQKGFCTNCHNPHASDFGPLLTQDERDLCVTCHPMGREFARTQVHPPAGNRFCTNCHNPHASEWKGILVRRQRELCFMCHPTVAPLSLKSVQHNPFEFDNCTGCHEPHGSDFLPLLIKDQPDLCYMCHPGIRNDFLKPSHHPVGSVQLNCADCHNPHAADYQFLLDAGDNAFCYQCHSRAIEVTYEKSSHRVLLCIRCHTPHGSYNAPLLRARNPELCLRCHGWVDHRNAHPFQPRFYDTHGKKALTCTSSCHDPHGTQYPMMVNYPYRRDGLCLWCHPGVGIYF